MRSTTKGYVDIKAMVRERILEIGYDSSLKGFDGHSCGVMVAIGGQSGDIAQGVDAGHETAQRRVRPTRSTGRAPATRA